MALTQNTLNMFWGKVEEIARAKGYAITISRADENTVDICLGKKNFSTVFSVGEETLGENIGKLGLEGGAKDLLSLLICERKKNCLITTVGDYEGLKKTLRIEFIPLPIARVKHYLFTKVLSWAAIYSFEYDGEREYLYDGFLKLHGLTLEKLHEDALKASAMTNPVVVSRAGDLFKMLCEEEIVPSFIKETVMNSSAIDGIVLKGKYGGSAAVLYPGALKETSKKFFDGKSFVVVPLTDQQMVLHEIADIEHHQESLVDVNSLKEMPAREVLSWRVLFYNAETDKLVEVPFVGEHIVVNRALEGDVIKINNDGTFVAALCDAWEEREETLVLGKDNFEIRP